MIHALNHEFKHVLDHEAAGVDAVRFKLNQIACATIKGLVKEPRLQRRLCWHAEEAELSPHPTPASTLT